MDGTPGQMGRMGRMGPTKGAKSELDQVADKGGMKWMRKIAFEPTNAFPKRLDKGAVQWQGSGCVRGEI
jgi:hypothetical protein